LSSSRCCPSTVRRPSLSRCRALTRADHVGGQPAAHMGHTADAEHRGTVRGNGSPRSSTARWEGQAARTRDAFPTCMVYGDERITANLHPGGRPKTRTRPPSDPRRRRVTHYCRRVTSAPKKKQSSTTVALRVYIGTYVHRQRLAGRGAHFPRKILNGHGHQGKSSAVLQSCNGPTWRIEVRAHMDVRPRPPTGEPDRCASSFGVGFINGWDMPVVASRGDPPVRFFGRTTEVKRGGKRELATVTTRASSPVRGPRAAWELVSGVIRARARC